MRNPKVATSTLLDWLDWMNTGLLGPPTGNIRKLTSLPRPPDVGWDRVMRMVDGDAFRFSFVRDPLTRFESAFRSKITRQTPSRRATLEVLGRPSHPDAEVTFEEFVGAVEQQDPLHMDLHWRPQYLNLMHPIFTFDFLGRLETFDRDIEIIRQRLELPTAPVRARNVSTSARPSEFGARPDLAERVRALYARDIELYGY